MRQELLVEVGESLRLRLRFRFLHHMLGILTFHNRPIFFPARHHLHTPRGAIHDDILRFDLALNVEKVLPKRRFTEDKDVMVGLTVRLGLIDCCQIGGKTIRVSGWCLPWRASTSDQDRPRRQAIVVNLGLQIRNTGRGEGVARVVK